jgi:hypothetical protein
MGAILLVWAVDLMEIITLASKAFATYYLLQTFLACELYHFLKNHTKPLNPKMKPLTPKKSMNVYQLNPNCSLGPHHPNPGPLEYVIKNITGRTYWKSCSMQEGMRHRKRHDGLLFNYHLCK